MLSCDEHVDGARKVGFCDEDLELISNSYWDGYRDGTEANRSCLPLSIIISNLIREFLVGEIPKHWKNKEIGCGDRVVRLMARAYYDGYNERVSKSGILSSEYFPLG